MSKVMLKKMRDRHDVLVTRKHLLYKMPETLWKAVTTVTDGGVPSITSHNYHLSGKLVLIHPSLNCLWSLGY